MLAAALLWTGTAAGGCAAPAAEPTGPRGEAAARPAAHPAALSLLELIAEPDGLRAQLTVQELTLREVPRWFLDDDLDGRISSLELETHLERVDSLFAESLWFEDDAGTRWTPHWRVHAYEGMHRDAPGGGRQFDRVVFEAHWPRGAPPEALTVHSALFLDEGNPGHRTVIAARGFGTEVRRGLLDAERRSMEVRAASAGSLFADYVRLGGEHVLEGWDHLAFLLALMLGVAGLRALVAAVTAFTLAHTITLAASALDVLRLSPALVEPGIAASVLIVAWMHLRSGPADARPWLPAFLFGLLHGCGFAGVLGEIGLPPHARVTGLLGFNVGVELGQLAFVLPVALGVALARRLPAGARRFLYQAAAVAVLAFATRLVGAQLDAYLLQSPSWGGAELRALLAGGAAAGLLALVPASAERAHAARVLLGQGVLVLACYVAGTALAAPQAS